MVKVAQVGIGRWGKNHLRNYYQLHKEGQCELALVCDLDQKNIDAAQHLYPDIKYTKNFEDVLNDRSIEAVIVATPASTHFQLGQKILSAGKHVFIEKPIVLKHQQLEELIELADKNKKIIMEGHLLLYHGAVNKMREAIQSGLIGEVQEVYCRRTGLGAIRFEGNVLWDLGTHDLSIVYYLLDEQPENVSAQSANFYPQKTDEVVFTALKFGSGKIAHIHNSWLDPFKDRKAIVVGTKGMLVMDELATDGKVKHVKKHVAYDPTQKFEHDRYKYVDEGVEVLNYPEVEPLRTECEHFIKAIQTKTAVRSNGRNSLRILNTLEAAQASLDNGGVLIQYEKIKELKPV